MSALNELTAAPVPITIAGQKWFLSPLRLVDWGEAARVVAGRRKSPLAIVKQHLSGLSDELARHLVDLAYRDERSGELFALEEVERWFATPEGNVYRAWLMLRRQHPSLTLDQVEELLLTADADQDSREWISRQSEESAAPPNVGFFSAPSPTGRSATDSATASEAA